MGCRNLGPAVKPSFGRATANHCADLKALVQAAPETKKITVAKALEELEAIEQILRLARPKLAVRGYSGDGNLK